MKGKVWLAGAGSLESALVSEKTKQVLKKADCILYDSLLCDDLLKYASHAKLVFTGKRQGAHSLKQQDISLLLAECACQYKRVVRLKGGDSLLFSRISEEMQILNENGIDYEVIPGISSLQALASVFKMPLTERDSSGGILIVSGHSADESQLLSIDLQTAADFQGTLAIFMGFSRLEKIMTALIEAGMDPARPAALLYTESRLPLSVAGTVFDLACKCQKASAPAIIVIGNVIRKIQTPVYAGFCSTYDFYKKTAKKMDLSVYPSMLIEMEVEKADAYDYSIDRLKNAGLLVFTSVQGSRLFLKGCKDSKIDDSILASFEIACIGKHTAKPFIKKGIMPVLISKNRTTEDLCKDLLELRTDKTSCTLFRAENASADMENFLLSRFKTERVNLYRLKAKKENDSRHFDCLIFGSYASAEAYLEEFGKPLPEQTVFCIGAKTAEAFKDCQIPVILPEKISASSLAKAVNLHASNTETASQIS